MERDRITRRNILGLVGTAVVGGCVGGGNTSQETETTVTTTEPRFSCSDDTERETEQVARKYESITEDLIDTISFIGSKEQFEVDAVFGADTAFNALNCSGSGGCETEYLTAIERLQDSKERLQGIEDDFTTLGDRGKACEVSEHQLLAEQTNYGIEKVRVYVDAVDLFIKSAKRHVDEDVPTFTPGKTFEDGFAKYEEAHRMPLMQGDRLEKKMTVYNG